MPIKTTKKKKESHLQKISREMEEEYERKVKAAESKRIADEKETHRKETIIKAYLDKLESQLKEKNILGFWTFVDRSGFKKFHGINKDVEKMLNKDVNKYIDRQLAEYTIIFNQNDKPDSMHKKAGIWLNVTIRTYNIIENDNKLKIETNKQCDIAWKTDDFAISKFSLKLIELFMKPLAEKKTSCVSLMGLPLDFVLDRYKKDAGVDFSDVLQPLKNM
jgi:hypothetical protein